MSAQNLSGYIYFVESEIAFTVGYTASPHKRFKTLQSNHYQKLKLSDYFQLPRAVERDFRSEFALVHLGNNWYPISVRQDAIDYLSQAESSYASNPAVELDQSTGVLPDLVKSVYVSKHLDIKDFILSCQPVHRNDEFLQKVLEFGSDPIHSKKLGLSVPVTSAGPGKGKPDPIRYFNKILGLFRHRLELDRQIYSNERQRLNLYRIVKAD